MSDVTGDSDDRQSPQAVDLDLLRRLQAANKQLEQDEKSLQSLSAFTPGHSRKGSGSSLMSNTSSNSHVSNLTFDEEVVSVVAGESVWDLWGRMVNDWDSSKKKPNFIKELVRKGIPHHFRGLAWQLLLNVHDSPSKDLYMEYLKKTSPSEKIIRRDIARTFPEHQFFREKDGLGQESLFNVMKAYSLHDREVGYCQGSGFIVGLLLMQMPEEETFAVLVKLMQEYRLRELFKPSMAELGLCMFQLEYLVQELVPALHIHFHTQCFHTSMYASSWFLTLFATSLPLSLACRVMDLFISEGMEMIFRIAISILQTSQEELLSQDMEGMLRFFQKQVPIKYEQDPDSLLQAAYQVKYNSKKIKKLEREYNVLKTKENEEQVELRRLRSENRLLRQRIDNLEKESASLADRLIQDQVTRAQEAEETFILKNALSSTRHRFSDTTKRLVEVEAVLAEIKERTNVTESVSSLDEATIQELVQQLQDELVLYRLKEVENSALVKELRLKITELGDTNMMLQKAPTNEVQHLQEELIAVKLREAEATLSMKELRQRVNELERSWEKHREKRLQTSSPKDKNKKQEVHQLQDDLMSVKIREAQSLSDLKEMKQKVMELETQNQICTNQIRRMDEDNKTLKTKIIESEETEKSLRQTIKELERQMGNNESKKKEDSMMIRIQEAENSQLFFELRQNISQLGIEKEELLTAGQLYVKQGTQDLENKIFDLKDEVLELKLNRSRSDKVSPNSDSEEEEEDDPDPELLDSESLNRTLSDIIEGRSPLVNGGDATCTNNNLKIDSNNRLAVIIFDKLQTSPSDVDHNTGQSNGDISSGIMDKHGTTGTYGSASKPVSSDLLEENSTPGQNALVQ